MKADKKAIEKLTTFGKIMYQISCLQYVEETKEPFDKIRNEIRFKFIIRWWHIMSIVSLIVIVLIGVIKDLISTCKDFIHDHSVVSGYFMRER